MTDYENKKRKLYLKKREQFYFQWHITNKCNLRCRHCYIDDYAIEPSFATMVSILGRIVEFLDENNGYCHLSLMGGEPFVSPHLFRILDYIEMEKNIIEFSLGTNGLLLTQEIIDKLKTYSKFRAIQISIDGTPETHDSIRGKGTFEKALNSVKLLHENGRDCSVSFTANRLNYKQFPKVAELAFNAGAGLVWTDRVVPLGDADKKKDIIDNLLLTDEEFLEYIDAIKEANDKFDKIGIERKLIALHLKSPQMHGCYPGVRQFSITANGDLLPCRRMDENFGSIIDKKISEVLQEHRDIICMINDIPDDCKKCKYVKKCRGGAKCQTCAVYGDYNHPDPNCLFFKSNESDRDGCNGCAV